MSSRVADLQTFLDYEVRRSTRYRHFVSLVMVARRNGRMFPPVFPIHTIRRSDQVFAGRDSAVILMSETDSAGAMQAVQRLRTSLAETSGICFAVSSYPLDGQTAPQLLAVLEGRLTKAKALGQGAVVASG